MPDPSPPRTGPDAAVPPDPSVIIFINRMQEDFTRLQMEHRFAVDEVLTSRSCARTCTCTGTTPSSTSAPA